LGSHSGPKPLKQKYILGEGTIELFGSKSVSCVGAYKTNKRP